MARKSFFRISEVELKWSPNGSALLVCGYCEVDSSNKNYYGESSLHFLKADGSLDCKVDLSKEGPVHDSAVVADEREFRGVLRVHASQVYYF